MEALCWIVLAAAAALGIFAAAWWERVPPTRADLIPLFALRGHIEDLEYKLRQLRQDADRGHFGNPPAILLLDLGMDGECEVICRRIIEAEPIFLRCTPESVCDTLAQLCAETGGSGEE